MDLVLAGASLLFLAVSIGAVDEGQGIDLLPMSREQVAQAGAAGTGCSFVVGGRTTVFAAADDRAIIRLFSGIVTMRPGAGAADLFPFTFDRWEGGELRVSVQSVGRATVRSAESITRQAILSVKRGDVAVERRGTLDCGS